MRTLPEGFEIAAASVTGSVHRDRGCGSQDGFCVAAHPDAIVAVITDGCGGASHSEVGARIGASLWARALAATVDPGGALDTLDVAGARAEVVATLGALADAMTPVGRARDTIISDHFLFTTIAAVITARWTTVLAIGDGLVGINGTWLTIEPFTDNQPAYVAYDLIGGLAHLAPITLFTTLPTASIEHLVLATDGAGALAPDNLNALLETDDIYDNRDALRRVLHAEASSSMEIDWDRERVIRGRPTLSDDTTLISIRREDRQ